MRRTLEARRGIALRPTPFASGCAVLLLAALSACTATSQHAAREPAPAATAPAAAPTATPGTPSADSTSTTQAPPAESQGLLPIPDYTGDLAHRTHLTGDWGGTRTEWAENGVQMELDWTQYLQGVSKGGFERGTEYGGHFDYLMNLDLMRMGLVPGALVTMRAESRYGDSVNGQAGPVLPVNTTAFFPLTDTLDESVPLAITNLYYTQFLSERFALLAGKIDTLDADLNEFASGRGKSQFMDANFLFNSALALRLPYSTLGVGALWRATDTVTVNASLINTTDASTTSGLDDVGDGSSASAEVDWQYRMGDLPGGSNVGCLYSFDQNFSDIGGQLIFQPGQGIVAPNQDHTWALYYSAWQYLTVEDHGEGPGPLDVRNGEPDRQGFGAFGRFGIADQDTNPVEWSASVGVGGRGLIETRDDDVFGVGYYRTSYQDSLIFGAVGLDDHAQGVEAFYNRALTKAANLTFDVQLQDSAQPDTNTALILGARLNLRF